MNKISYWDTVVEGNRLYQMGAYSHRIFLLDLLKEHGVKSILDVGCGTGPIWELIKNEKTKTVDFTMSLQEEKTSSTYTFAYKGVDPAASMIRTTKHHFPEVTWEVQDARDLKEADNSWDCVLMMHSLDYVYEYEKAISETARVAKRFVLIVLWQTIDYREGAENKLNNSVDGNKENDWSLAHLQHFAWGPLAKAFTHNDIFVLRKEEDIRVN